MSITCEPAMVASWLNAMTSTASRAQNPSLRSKRVRGSPLNTGTLTVATPQVRSNATRLCNKLITTWSFILPNSSAMVAFSADSVNVQYASSSLPRRAVKELILDARMLPVPPVQIFCTAQVNMPNDEHTLSASSEYSDVQVHLPGKVQAGWIRGLAVPQSQCEVCGSRYRTRKNWRGKNACNLIRGRQSAFGSQVSAIWQATCTSCVHAGGAIATSAGSPEMLKADMDPLPLPQTLLQLRQLPPTKSTESRA